MFSPRVFHLSDLSVFACARDMVAAENHIVLLERRLAGVLRLDAVFLTNVYRITSSFPQHLSNSSLDVYNCPLAHGSVESILIQYHGIKSTLTQCSSGAVCLLEVMQEQLRILCDLYNRKI